MSDEERGFHRAIDAAPADRAALGAYSDWLRDHGRDDEAEAVGSLARGEHDAGQFWRVFVGGWVRSAERERKVLDTILGGEGGAA